MAHVHAVLEKADLRSRTSAADAKRELQHRLKRSTASTVRA